MKDLLLTLHQKVQQGVDLRLERPQWEALFQQIAAEADAEEPPPAAAEGPRKRGKTAQSKGRNLLGPPAPSSGERLGICLYARRVLHE